MAGRIKRRKATGNCRSVSFQPPSTQIYRGVAKYGARSLPAPRRPTNGRFRGFPQRRPFKASGRRTITRRLISITSRVTPYAVVLSESRWAFHGDRPDFARPASAFAFPVNAPELSAARSLLAALIIGRFLSLALCSRDYARVVDCMKAYFQRFIRAKKNLTSTSRTRWSITLIDDRVIAPVF